MIEMTCEEKKGKMTVNLSPCLLQGVYHREDSGMSKFGQLLDTPSQRVDDCLLVPLVMFVHLLLLKQEHRGLLQEHNFIQRVDNASQKGTDASFRNTSLYRE